MLVMRQGHPSARAKLTMERFLRLQSIAVTSRRSGRSNIEEAVRRAGFQLTPVMRVPHLLPALSAVRATDCVVVAPAATVPTEGLVCRELPFAMRPLQLSQYWRGSTDDPSLRWLRGVIRGSEDSR